MRERGKERVGDCIKERQRGYDLCREGGRVRRMKTGSAA